MLTQSEKQELAELIQKWNATDILPAQRLRLFDLETKRDELQKVLLLSGGRTSGFMLHEMLKAEPNYRQEWLTIFCNTGKEMPQTLDFVHEMETRWQVPVIWLEYDRVQANVIPPGIFPTAGRNRNLAKAAQNGEDTHWFRRVNYESASRNGEPFDTLLNWMSVLPNVVGRGCSMQLKIRTAMRYLFAQGFKEYQSNIGIRYDESIRSVQILANCDSYEHPAFPLIASKITEPDVMRFWKQHDFDLQLRSYQGNCDLCFLKKKWKRVLMAKQNPESLQWWKGWEAKKALTGSGTNGNGARFRLGKQESYAEIEELAKNPTAKILKQIEEDGEQDIACSCVEKAFNPDPMDDPMF